MKALHYDESAFLIWIYMDNQLNNFITSDLSLCAALCCLDYQIKKLEKNGAKVIFFIANDEELETIVEKFWSHQLKVDPLRYFNCLKEVKTRIYSF